MCITKLCTTRFKIGPRRVILTDITHLYYGISRNLIYLCTFKDAFTNEILGYHISKRMNVSLVKKAHDKMMENHRKEIKTKKCYIHSDQGSQYLATELKKILNDDGFIQSTSARGNSQDNTPMESFFGRLKTEAIDIIAMCKTFETAVALIDGYMDSYNNQRYQYALAGLTPSEYYQYMITGIYPLDSYYGVKASDLHTAEQITEARRKKAIEKAEKRREANEKERKERGKYNDALDIILRDQKKIMKQIKNWKSVQETAKMQLEHLNKLLDKTKKAIEFYMKSSLETRELLKDPLGIRVCQEKCVNYFEKI